MTHTFPKIIWQTHNYVFDQLPEYLNKVCATWVNLNPEWKYVYVDHIQRENLVADLAPHLLNIYKKLEPMQQVDIWRYLITYEYGGLYADMDSVCIKPLDQMLEEICDSVNIDPEMIVVPRLPNKIEPEAKAYTNTANYLIKKKSKIMKQILDSLVFQSPNSNGMGKCLCGKEHFIATKGMENFNPHSTLINFQVIVEESDKKDVLFSFDAARHENTFKRRFIKDFVINYYGQNIEYDKFIKENNLELIYRNGTLNT